MTYKLAFDGRAEKEWNKLGHTVKAQFKKKLATVLVHPRITTNKLSGLCQCRRSDVITQTTESFSPIPTPHFPFVHSKVSQKSPAGNYHNLGC
jgi:hypothetical protein